MSLTRLAALAVTALSLTACNYDCGVVQQTVANGTARDAYGAVLATVQVDLRENMRPDYLRLGVGVMGSANSAGAPLRGHVTRARFVTESGDLIAEIPLSTATLYLDAVVALNVDVTSEDEYERIRTALLSTRARVILDTDLPGRARIEAVLSDARDLPANIQQCSFS